MINNINQKQEGSNEIGMFEKILIVWWSGLQQHNDLAFVNQGDELYWSVTILSGYCGAVMVNPNVLTSIVSQTTLHIWESNAGLPVMKSQLHWRLSHTLTHFYVVVHFASTNAASQRPLKSLLNAPLFEIHVHQSRAELIIHLNLILSCI